MTTLTIAESVKEELAFIGAADGDNGSKFAIGKRITNPDRYLSAAERAALDCGWRLEVSWAEARTPEPHRTGLVLAYEKEHGHKPGFERPDNGEWAPGPVKLVYKFGLASTDTNLDWSEWVAMDRDAIKRFPISLGVYRVRAVRPGAQSKSDSDTAATVPSEAQATGSAFTRVTIDEFVRQAPGFVCEVVKWRNMYLENNMCVFKVEAFIQRKDDPVLSKPMCEKQLPWVENRINELTGKMGADLTVDDIEIVYRWGGGRGPSLFAKIVNPKYNSITTVKKQTKVAQDALEKEDPVEALRQSQCLKHVGNAFGSKVLAMHSPWVAPIWDDIAQHCMSEFRIGGRKVKSYEQFIRVCEHIADGLQREGIDPPLGCDGKPRARVDGRWWLRDIEMAIFQFGWRENLKPGRMTGSLP